MSSWQIQSADVCAMEFHYSDDDGSKYSIPPMVSVKLRSTDGALGDDGQDYMYVSVEWNADAKVVLQNIANEVNRKRQAKKRTQDIQDALQGKMIRIPNDGDR